MPKALTAPQQAAMDKITSQGGSLAGIGRGMIAALEKKGWLSDTPAEPQKPQSVAARAPKIKGLPDYTGKSWNSLSDLRDRILADGREEIVSFDGVTLRTDRRVFGLAFGELTVEKA